MSRNFEYKGHWFETSKSLERQGQTIFYHRPYWTARTLGKNSKYLFSSKVSLADLRKQIREYVDSGKIEQTPEKS